MTKSKIVNKPDYDEGKNYSVKEMIEAVELGRRFYGVLGFKEWLNDDRTWNVEGRSFIPESGLKRVKKYLIDLERYKEVFYDEVLEISNLVKSLESKFERERQHIKRKASELKNVRL
jgi:hypothetical protein